MTIKHLHPDDMTPEISRQIDQKLMNTDKWSQDALRLIRKIVLLQDPVLTNEKLMDLQYSAKALLPQRFHKETWGGSGEH